MSRKTLSPLVLRLALVVVAFASLPRAGAAAELTNLHGVHSTGQPTLLASLWNGALTRLGFASSSSTPPPAPEPAAAIPPIVPTRGAGIDPDGVHTAGASIAVMPPSRKTLPLLPRLSPGDRTSSRH